MVCVDDCLKKTRHELDHRNVMLILAAPYDAGYWLDSLQGYRTCISCQKYFKDGSSIDVILFR